MASIFSSAGQNRRKNHPREAAWDRAPILHCSDCQLRRRPFSEHVYVEGRKGVEKNVFCHSIFLWFLNTLRASLAVQWLRRHTSKAGGVGLVPGRRTKILTCHGCSQNNKKLINKIH